jgi:hypothetical protein
VAEVGEEAQASISFFGPFSDKIGSPMEGPVKETMDKKNLRTTT